MATTFELISAVTVGSGGAASIDFTSIPSTYTDLCLKLSARGTEIATYVNNRIAFNGSTSGYSSRLLFGLGSGTPSSASNAVTTAIDYSAYGNASTSTSSTFGNTEIYIPNYAGSNNKSVSIDAVTENNATSAIAALTAGLWANSAAITSISITPDAGQFVQYTNAYLYGVKNA